MGGIDDWNLTSNQMMAIALFGGMALVALSVLAVLIRRWGRQMPKTHPSGGLDLAALQRQFQAGLITPEEFEIISRRLAGVEGPSASLPRRPIEGKGTAEGVPPAAEGGPPDEEAGPEGSRRNGKG
jgi:hypothetical protein